MGRGILNPVELLHHLEAEGVTVSLNLKATAKAKPSDELRALIKQNRDAILEHLTFEHAGSLTVNYNLAPHNDHALVLYGDLLVNLMTWTAKFYELRLEHPAGLILNATPEHIQTALTKHLWGVVYDAERFLLISWGNVPPHALLDKRDLTTGEVLLPEKVAA